MLNLTGYYGNIQTYFHFGDQQWNENLADDFIPYGEVCTHVYSGLHLFSFDADLFETTFYVTTRLQKDRYGRLIDLEHVNPKSKEAFARKYEGKVETFKPYTKYYFFAQNISFDDLTSSAIEKGKKAMEGLVHKGVELASDKIEDKLAQYADEVNDPDTFKEKLAKDPKLEDLEFANIEKGGTVNFQIGPVPAYLSFGMIFRVPVSDTVSITMQHGFAALQWEHRQDLIL